MKHRDGAENFRETFSNEFSHDERLQPLISGVLDRQRKFSTKPRCFMFTRRLLFLSPLTIFSALDSAGF